MGDKKGKMRIYYAISTQIFISHVVTLLFLAPSLDLAARVNFVVSNDILVWNLKKNTIQTTTGNSDSSIFRVSYSAH